MANATEFAEFFVEPEVRAGLKTTEAEDLQRPEKFGFNELPCVEVSKMWLLLTQFMGTMPYMLEVAAIVAVAAQDYIDFAILCAMLLCNGALGFREELECMESLVRFTLLSVFFSFILQRHIITYEP